METTEVPIRLEVSAQPTGGKWTVEVKLSDGVTHIDTFNLLTSSKRDRFVADVAKRFPQVPQDDLRNALTAEASSAAARQESASAGAADEPDGPDGRERDSKQRDVLVGIAEQAIARGDLEVFMTPGAFETEVYATFRVKSGRRTCPVRSRPMELWLHKEFKKSQGCSPSSNSLQEALFSIGARPEEGDPRFPVLLRVGEIDGTLWIDLCDDQYRAVRIRGGRWDVVEGDEVTARFQRKPGMSALPTPERGGSINLLRDLVNMPDDGMFVLYVSAIVGFFHPTGPYPALVFSGEKGSAKSTSSSTARDLVDPNIASLRRPPKEARDLIIAASSGHVLTLENMDELPPAISDLIASILTGVGYGTRLLYSDEGEKLFSVCKPVIINGIPLVATRPDLLERSICLHLPRLPDEKRMEEAELRERFQQVKPLVLGAILDGVAAAHAGWRKVKLKNKPRMADFASWAAAAAPALGWSAETFMAAYTANAASGQRSAIDASPIGSAVLELLDNAPEWVGTCEELLSALAAMPSGGKVQGRSWPSHPRGLRAELDALAPSLRAESIESEFGKRTADHKRRRIVSLKKSGGRPSEPSDGPQAAPASSGGASSADDGVDDVPGEPDEPVSPAAPAVETASEVESPAEEDELLAAFAKPLTSVPPAAPTTEACS